VHSRTVVDEHCEDSLLDQQILRQRRRLLGATCMLAAVLLATVLSCAVIKPGRNMWSDLAWHSLFGGTTATGIACLVAAFSRKPLVLRDWVRMCCWGLVGASLVVGNSGQYYFFYWRPYSSMVRGLSVVVLWAGLCGLIAASVLLPGWRPQGPGHCLQCGYLLKGLTIPRCPECGLPFEPSSEGGAHEHGNEDGANSRTAGPS